MIYATWQQSLGLNIPGERMEKEPFVWELLCEALREQLLQTLREQSRWYPVGTPSPGASLRRGQDCVFGVIAERLQAQEELLTPCPWA